MHGDASGEFAELSAQTRAALSADERWMLAKLDAGAASITTALKEFRFHSAAHELYDLVWSDFCDWFIEAEKVPLRAGGEAKERALAVLDYALSRILRLLHPFMPFITEELYHAMGFAKDGETHHVRRLARR